MAEYFGLVCMTTPSYQGMTWGCGRWDSYQVSETGTRVHLLFLSCVGGRQVVVVYKKNRRKSIRDNQLCTIIKKKLWFSSFLTQSNKNNILNVTFYFKVNKLFINRNGNVLKERWWMLGIIMTLAHRICPWDLPKLIPVSKKAKKLRTHTSSTYSYITNLNIW